MHFRHFIYLLGRSPLQYDCRRMQALRMAMYFLQSFRALKCFCISIAAALYIPVLCASSSAIKLPLRKIFDFPICKNM